MILATVYSEHISPTPTMSYNRPYTKTEYLKSLDEADKYHKEHDISQHSHLAKKEIHVFSMSLLFKSY